MLPHRAASCRQIGAKRAHKIDRESDSTRTISASFRVPRDEGPPRLGARPPRARWHRAPEPHLSADFGSSLKLRAARPTRRPAPPPRATAAPRKKRASARPEIRARAPPDGRRRQPTAEDMAAAAAAPWRRRRRGTKRPRSPDEEEEEEEDDESVEGPSLSEWRPRPTVRCMRSRRRSARP